MKKIPTCNKCGQDHYNFRPCPPAQPPVQYLRRQPPPDGYHVSGDWGVKTKSVPLVYTLPPQPSHGRLIGPDGHPHVPRVPE